MENFHTLEVGDVSKGGGGSGGGLGFLIHWVHCIFIDFLVK